MPQLLAFIQNRIEKKAKHKHIQVIKTKVRMLFLFLINY